MMKPWVGLPVQQLGGGISVFRYADCGPSRLRKSAHEQATRAFTTIEKTTATDLLQLIFC